MNYFFKQLALMLILAASGLNVAQAVAITGKQINGSVSLQGGSESMIQWLAPDTQSYKIHVFVPNNAATTNALYRVYPKGKKANVTTCKTNALFPCYEISIDQSAHQNSWVQLTLNNDAATQWDFVKAKGRVMAVADNLAATEMLNLSALVSFENTVLSIGKVYQGGIIFYVDQTGAHGLIAAQTDQSSGIQWWNGSYVNTGALDTAIGKGLLNTKKIIKAQGPGKYAATLSVNAVINGYKDWYLPSLDELKLMYNNIGPGAAAPLTNIGHFVNNYYWSSSQYQLFYALPIYFGSTPLSDYRDAYDSLAVRAIRAF